MTDKETLFLYRLREAEETLAEAKRMLEGSFAPRSIINRIYYSLFYLLLALFLKSDVNVRTSKHKGIIALFDIEFVKTGKLDKHYSGILHDIFDARQEGDYKEFAQFSLEDAAGFFKLAGEFMDAVRKLMGI